MAHTIAPSMPAETGEAGQTSRRRTSFAARRRVVVLFMLLLLGGMAFLANYGPVNSYRDAKARLLQATDAVSALENEKAALQSQLGKLSEVGYMESLAREKLSYTRPGEELFIVTGLEESTERGATEWAAAEQVAADQAAAQREAGEDGLAATPDRTAEADSGSAEADGPGFFERALNAILGLF